MSILNQIKTSRSSNPWTTEQIKLAVGLKMLGASNQKIASATSHPVNSIPYLFGKKLTTPQLDDAGNKVTVEQFNEKTGTTEQKEVRVTVSDERLLQLCGATSAEEIKQYAEDFLNAEMEEETTRSQEHTAQ